MKIHLPTESEANVLRKMITEYRRSGRKLTWLNDDDDLFAPEVYVAKTPSGGIPALSGSITGSAVCTIYKMDPYTGTGTGSGEDVLELVQAGFDETVHNVSDIAIPGESYKIVWRDKFGDWVTETPDCPCTICEIYSTDFTSDPLSDFTSTGWTYDGSNLYAYTSGESNLILDTPATDTPYNMKLTVRFYTASAGTVRLWVGYDTSTGAGWYMELKTSTVGNAGEVRFYSHNGTSATLMETSNERTIWELKHSEWYTATLCLDLDDGVLTGTIENGDLVGQDFTITTMLDTDQAIGAYSAFEAVSASVTVRINIYTLDVVSQPCDSCGHSCYIAYLPDNLESTVTDEVTTTGTITKTGVYNEAFAGSGTVEHLTTYDEMPYVMSCSGELDPGATVTMYFDDLSRYISLTLSADRKTWTMSVSGFATKYQYAPVGYWFDKSFGYHVCRHTAGVIVYQWGIRLNDDTTETEASSYYVASFYQAASLAGGATGKKFKLSIPADSWAIGRVNRHRATDSFNATLCPGCTTCDTCDPAHKPPDVIFVDLSEATFDDIECSFCPNMNDVFALTRTTSDCQWYYAELAVCSLGAPCGVAYNLQFTLQLTLVYGYDSYSGGMGYFYRLTGGMGRATGDPGDPPECKRGIGFAYTGFFADDEHCDDFPITLTLREFTQSANPLEICSGSPPSTLEISDL